MAMDHPLETVTNFAGTFAFDCTAKPPNAVVCASSSQPTIAARPFTTRSVMILQSVCRAQVLRALGPPKPVATMQRRFRAMKTERILLVICLFLTAALFASAAWAGALPAAAPTIDPWQPLTPPPGSQVTALAASPQFATDQTVFSATDTGVYRSLDRGHSWTAISTDIRRAHKIVLSPGYPADPDAFRTGSLVGPAMGRAVPHERWRHHLARGLAWR